MQLSDWVPHERYEGPDLAHIQDLLLQEGPSTQTQSQGREPQNTSSPNNGSKRRADRKRFQRSGRSGTVAHNRRLLERHPPSRSEWKRKPVEQSSYARNPVNPLSKGYEWKLKWQRYASRMEDAGAEDWCFDLREAALKELIHHAGVADGEFHRLAERVTIDRLQDNSFMLSEWVLPRRFFLQHSVNKCEGGVLSLGVDFSMMAVLSHALATGRVDPQILHLEVVEAHDSDYAGALTGLIMVVRALPLSNVRTLTLALYSQGIRQRLQRFQAVKAAMSESLKRVSCLREIKWTFVDTHKELPIVELEDELQIARSTEYAVKTLLLLAGHRKMQGRCKLLGEVPQDVLMSIFEQLFGPRT